MTCPVFIIQMTEFSHLSEWKLVLHLVMYGPLQHLEKLCSPPGKSLGTLMGSSHPHPSLFPYFSPFPLGICNFGSMTRNRPAYKYQRDKAT